MSDSHALLHKAIAVNKDYFVSADIKWKIWEQRNLFSFLIQKHSPLFVRVRAGVKHVWVDLHRARSYVRVSEMKQGSVELTQKNNNKVNYQLNLQ